LLQTPTRTGNIHPILDQVTAGAFDNPGRDRQPICQCQGLIVLESFLIIVDVVGGVVY